MLHSYTVENSLLLCVSVSVCVCVLCGLDLAGLFMGVHSTLFLCINRAPAVQKRRFLSRRKQEASFLFSNQEFSHMPRRNINGAKCVKCGTRSSPHPCTLCLNWIQLSVFWGWGNKFHYKQHIMLVLINSVHRENSPCFIFNRSSSGVMNFWPVCVVW